VPVFSDEKFFVIAGPCVLENDALNLAIAEQLAKLQAKVPGGIVYKASFDKANRSNADAARGPGLEEGLRALERVKKESGLRVLTDVHLPDQCAIVAEVADVLQIPAFLCRQTDLLEAAGRTGKAVNIKKGQWMHPDGMRGAVEKVRGSTSASRNAKGDRRLSLPATRLSDIAVTDRGTFFGYGDLVVDMRDFTRLRDACGVPVIFDATHSVQRPGQGAGGTSGGSREYIEPLTLAAIAAGADGLFLETHPDPDHAPSDGPNMLPLKDLARLLDRALAVRAVVHGHSPKH
jgi:2-dehydro-3-deoxyphosphooctonate aldolase (KDO 8-P synthase)